MIIRQFGDEVLRTKARRLSEEEILDDELQELIAAMRSMLVDDGLGIGLAAPQVGSPLAIAVIEIQQTEYRMGSELLSMVMINPVILSTRGRRTQMWEGCISSGAGKAGLFAKVPRYKKLELQYHDENAQKHIKTFEGLAAHVVQHEVDHLNGILFVDKVKDTKTLMTSKQYKAMINSRT